MASGQNPRYPKGMDNLDPFPRLQKAIRFAAKKHAGQYRDGDAPLPYFSHPIEVLILVRHGAKVTDEDVLCAAVLHDVVEDCGVTFDKIEAKFGKRVREIVQQVTRIDPSSDQIQGMSPEQIWEMRNEILMEEIAQMGPEARCIKLADRLSNISESMHTRQGDKLERYIRQTWMILERIPRETCPALWDAIRACVEGDACGVAWGRFPKLAEAQD